ncbi:MAG: hypothetical protein SPG32_10840 [Candidatus Ventricola sp.]|nr:hypothetical protein [Candidatus Ventricola sp.]
MKEFALFYLPGSRFRADRAGDSGFAQPVWKTQEQSTGFSRVFHRPKASPVLAFWALSPLSTALRLLLLIPIYGYYPKEVDVYALYLRYQ